ncbi:hypothetical protein E5D57_006693 [Metarhizium anisopliae]|nr:hypothetical protein E5D57_006693 [Metarhizium anisopliae]
MYHVPPLAILRSPRHARGSGKRQRTRPGLTALLARPRYVHASPGPVIHRDGSPSCSLKWQPWNCSAMWVICRARSVKPPVLGSCIELQDERRRVKKKKKEATWTGFGANGSSQASIDPQRPPDWARNRS